MNRFKLLLLPLLLIASLIGFDRVPAAEQPPARPLVLVGLALAEPGGDFPVARPAYPRHSARSLQLKIIPGGPSRYAL